jgi:hypothetical protein
MASSDIITLSIVAVLTVAILVLGGLALSVRSFTVLTELIRSIGSEVVAHVQENRQAQTTSLKETERNILSALPEDTHTMPEKDG